MKLRFILPMLLFLVVAAFSASVTLEIPRYAAEPGDNNAISYTVGLSGMNVYMTDLLTNVTALVVTDDYGTAYAPEEFSEYFRAVVTFSSGSNMDSLDFRVTPLWYSGNDNYTIEYYGSGDKVVSYAEDSPNYDDDNNFTAYAYYALHSAYNYYYADLMDMSRFKSTTKNLVCRAGLGYGASFTGSPFTKLNVVAWAGNVDRDRSYYGAAQYDIFMSLFHEFAHSVHFRTLPNVYDLPGRAVYECFAHSFMCEALNAEYGEDDTLQTSGMVYQKMDQNWMWPNTLAFYDMVDTYNNRTVYHTAANDVVSGYSYDDMIDWTKDCDDLYDMYYTLYYSAKPSGVISYDIQRYFESAYTWDTMFR